MEEIWKDIKGYEGRYLVSNLGRILSLHYEGHDHQKIMRQSQHHTGYLIVHLRNKESRKTKLVHTLVATAFIPNPDQKKYVNHIDGNKTNNCVDNLEWVTSLENNQHAIANGLRNPHNVPKRYGADHYSSKPVYQMDLKGNVIKRWDCQSDVSRYFRPNGNSVNLPVDKPANTRYGYVWLSSPDKFSEWEAKERPKRRSKTKVEQYSKDGTLIKRWDSLSDLENNSGFNINGIKGCCRKGRKTHGGYIWKYAED